MITAEPLIHNKVRQMPMYKVLIHNDPITTFQFVGLILVTLFQKTPEEAIELAKQVDREGVGLAGIYPLEHAEHLVDQATSMARSAKFPLTFTIEPN